MIKILVPSVWASNGRTEFEGSEGPLFDVIRTFAEEQPGFRRRLLSPEGEPLRYLNICVDDELVPRELRASTVVEAGRTLTIMTPMAGG